MSGAVNNDVGLMMKLQAALKEVHREKEQLERKMRRWRTAGEQTANSLQTCSSYR